jgi:hypothetical protein
MGKLLRIRALSETRVPTTPTWTAVPVPVIFAGVAGGYTLPVANATSASWVGPGSQPAWLTFVDASPPRITWTAAATVQDIASVVLNATGPGGSIPCAPFTLSVQAAPPATGFFAGWQAVQHVATNYAADNDLGLNFQGKQSRMIAHPSGRTYYFGGDNPNSGEQRMWSLNASTWNTTTPSTGWRLEHPEWPLSGYQFPIHQDANAVAWDSKRRVFWVLAGYNFQYLGTTPPNYGGPAGVTGFKDVVSKFDPSKPIGTRWTPLALPMKVGSINGKEYLGQAFYDPVLDLAFHGTDAGPWVHAFDPATETFAFKASFYHPALDITNFYDVMHCLGIDPVNRWLYLIRTNRNAERGTDVYRVLLPNTRAGLPTNDTNVDWTSRATQVWTTAKPSLGGRDVLGFTAIIDGVARKMFAWLRGPRGSVDQSGEGGWGNNYKSGTVGRPEAVIGANAPYPSANTALLVDLDTGAEDFAQVPHMQFEDGQGWIIPTQTFYDRKHGILVYGIADESYCPNSLIKARHYSLRRKAVPNWMPANLHEWKALPNSTCETQLPAAVRDKWSGAEPAGSNCELDYAKNPWNYSGMAVRRRDSVALFHGGGGGDGRANGVLGFRLNANTGDANYGWCLPMQPTPRSKTITTWTGVGDSSPYNYEWNHTSANHLIESSPRTPVAVHSYRSATFFDSEDLWVRFGSQMIHPTDECNFQGVHGFRWSDAGRTENDWLLNVKDPFLYTVGESPGGRTCLKNPWTEDCVVGTTASFRWHFFNKAKGTWRDNVFYDADVGVALPVAFDPNWNTAIFVPSGGGVPVAMDFSSGDVPTRIAGSGASWGGPAGAEFNGRSDCSWTWDDDNECWWALKVDQGYSETDSQWGRFDIFKIVPTTKAGLVFTVTKISTTATTTRPSLTNVNNGLGNRFQWCAELGGIVLSTSYRDPIYFIKTSVKA